VAVRVYDRGRTRRAALHALAAIVLVAGSAPFAPAEPVEPSLWSRLQRIEAAFRTGDAQVLRPVLPVEAKVRVDLPGVTDGPRSYGPGQVEVVIQQVFAGNPDRSLTFRPEDVKVPAPGTAFARARWPRRSGSGATSEYVTFTLRAAGDDWRLHEILGSR
jgi:hypothetical protein